MGFYLLIKKARQPKVNGLSPFSVRDFAAQGGRLQAMASLPKLSIAAKLYAIFALLAAATVALAAVAVVSSREHAELTAELETAVRGTVNVEQVNGLIYAVVMESRGIYIAPDIPAAQKFGVGLLRFNDRIGEVVKDWRRVIRPEDAAQFDAFAARIAQFQEFRRELVRRGTEIGPPAGREWGDNDANRNVRSALNQDLEGLADLYAKRSRVIYRELDRGMQATSLILTALALVALALAGFGAVIIARAVARPLAAITKVTEAVASGTADVVVPYAHRNDEIGALARSVGVFRDAVRRNRELNHAVAQEGETRARREEQMASEIGRFSAEVEATVAELARITGQMKTASTQLAEMADRASAQTEGAAASSAEASSNVRDIASAAEELSASVMEIDRQVAQSNAIAEQAVEEAARTNNEINALDEAARRIGAVVKLITDIAEQTNLLALNATIEAARAGEAGRGFAVVASEVKALAGQTAKATEEISAQIAGMQQATVRSVEAIAAIQRTIREVGEVTATIAAAVTEQGAATREIARSAEIASRRTTDTSADVGRVGAATAETRGNAAVVKSVSEDLDSVASRIRAQVEEFFRRLRAA
jgi:methyl-accepting chemotaxis protein